MIEFGWSQLKRYCSEARVYRLAYTDPTTEKKHNVSLSSPHVHASHEVDMSTIDLEKVSIFNQNRKQLMEHVIPLATRSVPPQYFAGAKQHIARHLKYLLESDSKLLNATISPEDALRAHVEGCSRKMSVREYLAQETTILP